MRRSACALTGFGATAFATKGLAEPKLAKQAKAGAARGIRTPDPVITNDVLYQLSYCGELFQACSGTLISAAPALGKNGVWSAHSRPRG